MHKVNQDAMVMVEHAGTGSLLVAVFDGHGVQGHDVSGFVARNFVSTLLRDVRFTTPGTASGPGGTDVDMCEVLSEALLSAEKALLNESSIDCSLSGSTAVAGVLRAGRLWTIGVGDSRLVLGFVPQSRKNTGINHGDPPWYTRQVTVDHKPELPAEKRRIIAAGGRVMATRNRMAPHIVGPPRVWLRDMPAPGLAMSRSVGDMVGKAAGVVSTPDRFVVDLEGACRALILGSDGLWDFVANEEVVQTVQRCGSAKQAADALLRIARSRWLQRTGGADDTTIVVVYLRIGNGRMAAASDELGYEELHALRTKEQREREEAVAAFETVTAVERESRYQRAVKDLNVMLDKASKFNEACEDILKELNVGEVTKEPEGFHGTLRDYQLDGVNRLARMRMLSESCILADEMGLGKTVQIIAFICWLAKHEIGPALVVVPLSTLGNWVREFHKFAPGVEVVEYHGTQEERAALRREHIPNCPRKARQPLPPGTKPAPPSASAKTSKMSKENRLKMPVFVTTYAIAMRDRPLLGRTVVPWELLVVDESHRLKSVTSKLKKELEAYCWSRELDGTQKIILTGTPLQNDLIELWSLCNFVMPHIFADKEAFESVYGFLKLNSQSGKADVVARQERDSIITSLHSLLRRYVLRRTKAEVKLDLPPKVEVVLFCGLTPEQRRLGRAILLQRERERAEKARQRARGMLAFLEDPSKQRKELSGLDAEIKRMGWRVAPGMVTAGGGQLSMNNTMMQLRKVANHPYLFAEPDHRPAAEGAGDDEKEASDEEDEAVQLEGRRSRRAAARVGSYKEPTERDVSVYLSGSDEDGNGAAADEDEDEDEKEEKGASGKAAGGGKAIATNGTDGKEADEDDEDDVPPTDERIVTTSGKVLVLDRLLRRLKAGGHKVLIFSQFLRTLQILADYLEHRSEEFGGYCVLDGSTPREDRDDAMVRFNASTSNEDLFVFLISTRAGGLGINLTAADTVIIFDSDWNPHGDTQAEDRAHRIGQTRPVVVYRLVSASSVEEQLVRRANSKRALERVVLQDAARVEAAHAGSSGKKRRKEGSGSGGGGDDDVDMSTLQHWLRDDLTTQHATAVSLEAVDTLSDRSAVMQAGRHLLRSVEAERNGSSGKGEGEAAAAAVGGGEDEACTPSPANRKRRRRPPAPVQAKPKKGEVENASAEAVGSVLPTKGPGFEFVYHSAASLLALSGAGQ